MTQLYLFLGAGAIGLIGFILLLWKVYAMGAERERLKGDADAAKKQVDSVAKASQAEGYINGDEETQRITIKDWNATLLVLVSVGVLALGGCTRTKFVEPMRPLIDVPERPRIETAHYHEVDANGDRIPTPNELSLMHWGLSLEGRIKRYNEVAQLENEKNGYRP